MSGMNLSVGSRGAEVSELQRKLNQQSFPSPNLVVDGIFGEKTRQAVMAFQRRAGLKVDGIVGPMTKAALGMPTSGGNPFTHRVRLHFRSLALTDVPFNSILSHTQAVFAPYGIKIEMAGGMSLGLSPELTQKFDQVDGSCAWEITEGEYKELLELGAGIPGSDIAVFFVDRFSEAINGCGGHLKDRPACIVAKAGTRWCTAHEITHVLLGSSFSPVHINSLDNVMHSVDLERPKTPGFTAAQVARIKASPLCHAI